MCPADVEEEEAAVCHQRRDLRERLQIIINAGPTNASMYCMSAIPEAIDKPD